MFLQVCKGLWIGWESAIRAQTGTKTRMFSLARLTLKVFFSHATLINEEAHDEAFTHLNNHSHHRFADGLQQIGNPAESGSKP
jgi:hypothetical protein